MWQHTYTPTCTYTYTAHALCNVVLRDDFTAFSLTVHGQIQISVERMRPNIVKELRMFRIFAASRQPLVWKFAAAER
jgi:hypothetical protein